MAGASGILYKGFMTKSPPEHKLNRARWQRRWFVLRKCDNDVKLQYYKDQSQTRLKGEISLNECQQVDQGLSFESKKKYHDAFIFDIVTPKRKYFLVTDSEKEMIQWVENICQACGFKSEDDEVNVDTDSDCGGSTSLANQGALSGQRYSDSFSIRSAPMKNSSVQRASCIPLEDCETEKGSDNNMSKSLPNNLDADDPFRTRSGNFSSSDSSGGSSSALDSSITSQQFKDALRLKQNDPKVPANYDIPTVFSPSPNEENYAAVAASSPKRESIYSNTTRVSAKRTDPMSFTFERQISSPGVAQDTDIKRIVQDDEVYDIVPKRPVVVKPTENPTLPPEISDDIYSVVPRPVPVRPLLDSTVNPESAESDLRPIYDIPPCKTSLLDDIPPVDAQNDPEIIQEIYDFPPPRSEPPSLPVGYSIPPVHRRSELSSSTDQLARSFEEVSLRNSRLLETSDIYDIPSNLHSESKNPFSSEQSTISAASTPPRPPKPAHLSSSVSSQHDSTFDTYLLADFEQNPPFTNGYGVISGVQQPAAQGHVWLNKTIPTPSPKTRYVNTRDALLENNGGSQSSPMGYIAMQSVNSPSTVFHESYMPMEGSPSEGGVDLYTAMGSYPDPSLSDDGIMRPPPRLSTSSSASVFLDNLPPPVDRTNKPRMDSVSTIASLPGTIDADQFGMAESYYATGYDDSCPSKCSRTKSFTKNSRRYQGAGSPKGNMPQRSHTFTYSSSSSHGLHSSVSSDVLSPGFRSNVGDTPEDNYVFQQNSIEFETDTIDSLQPDSPTIDSKDKIEYLEIAHDEPKENAPPPRPPKLTSSKTEYIALDMEKTKALQDTQKEREKDYKGSES